MQTVVINRDEAPVNYKWAAYQDRRMRNNVNQTLYSDRQQNQLVRLKIGLEMVIKGRIFDISYDKNRAYVKIENGYDVVDQRSLKLLEEQWNENGIFRKVTPQGVMYQLERI